MLDAHGQTDGGLGDAGSSKRRLVGLGVRGGCWVYGQGAGVTDISEVGVELEGVDKRPGFLAAAVDVEGEDGAGVGVAELFLGGLVRRRIQAGVVDLGDLGEAFQVLGNGLGVGIVLFDTQPHRLNSIQRQPGVEGGYGGAGIA